MTRAPTYPIHRNRRNSISIRFSVRSIRFSRCGPGPVGPRPPASLALGGKEIHYPPRGAESRGGEFPLHRASTTRGGGNWRGPDKEEGRPAGRPEAGGPGGAKGRPAPVQGRAPVRGRGPLRGLGSLHACPNTRSKPPRKRRKAPGRPGGKEKGRPKAAPMARESALRERGSLSSRSLARQYFRRRRA